MTQKSKIKIFPIEVASLIKRMLAGALVGLILISLFLFSAGEGNPEWGKYWMIRPLIIVPLAGSMGGLFNYFVSQQDFRKGWIRTLALVFSLMVFIIGLWLGTVLGLDGTHWD